MFKRRGLVLACGYCLVLLQTSAVSASLQVGDTIRFYDREGKTAGGEFGVAKYGTTTELFRTFCLETNEFLDFDARGFKIVGITDKAVKGGSVGAGTGGDPLNYETKALYYWFREGILAGYDYTPNGVGHHTSADELQKAIWSLEEGQDLNATGSNGQAAIWIASARLWVGNNTARKALLDSRVKVLNLVYANRGFPTDGKLAQDQLYYQTPEPLSLTVWAGVGGVFCLFSRRRR